MDKKNSLAINGLIFYKNFNKKEMGDVAYDINVQIKFNISNLQLNSARQTIFR